MAKTFRHLIFHPICGAQKIRAIGNTRPITGNRTSWGIAIINPRAQQPDRMGGCTIRQLPNNKNPGPDLIPGEILRVAGLGCELALTHLFNAIWKAGVWPSRWQVATLIPLYKKSGDMSDPHNYRMLAMMNTLPKVLEKILERRMRNWAESVGALCDEQGGFRQEKKHL